MALTRHYKGTTDGRPRGAETAVMLEDNRPPELPPNAEFVLTDLNDCWPLCNETIDFGVCVGGDRAFGKPARHFMRKFTRILTYMSD